MTFPELQEKIRRWQRIGLASLKRVLTEAALMVMNEAQLRHLSGPKMPRGVGSATNATLAVRTGRLRRSIAKDIMVTPNEVRARVGTNVEYAAIHEFGGDIQIAARGQLAIMSKIEAWTKYGISGIGTDYKAGFTKARMSRKQMKFATMRLLKEHTVHMPERAFLRPSLATQHPRIFEMIDKAWMETYGK